MKKILPPIFLFVFYFHAFGYGSNIDSLQMENNSHPGDSRSCQALAGAYIEEKDYLSAINILRSDLDRDSANAQTLYLLGYVLDQTDFLPTAMAYYHKSLQCDSTYWRPYHSLAYLYDIFAQYDSMYYYLQHAIRYAPVPDSIYYDMGYCFDMQGQADSAMLYYYKAAAFDSLDSQAYMNLGAIWGEKGHPDSAKAYTQKSLRLNPNEAEACYNYGGILAGENSFEQAIDYYQKALVLDTSMVAAKAQLGLLYETLGDSAMAHIYYSEFVNSAPPIYSADIEKIQAKLKDYDK